MGLKSNRPRFSLRYYIYKRDGLIPSSACRWGGKTEGHPIVEVQVVGFRNVFNVLKKLDRDLRMSGDLVVERSAGDGTALRRWKADELWEWWTGLRPRPKPEKAAYHAIRDVCSYKG